MVEPWVTIMSSDENIASLPDFWKGVDVWISRPHIINRKLFGVEVLETWSVVLKCSIEETVKSILDLVQNTSELLDDKERFQLLFDSYEIRDFHVMTENDCSLCFLQFRSLLPRNPAFTPVLEIAFIDRTAGIVVFIPSKEVHTSPITVPNPYQICFSSLCKFELSIIQPETVSETSNPSITWLKTKVVPKILRWCSSERQNCFIPSLGLVSMAAYGEIYSNLKLKYGKKLVESWTESTDPNKFVYEDIGISAYLMTIWEEERKMLNCDQKQSFVDLGCGNGLLVHILASEGYPGIGIDVRKRKTWSSYGPETKLIERTIVPSDDILFPEYDWIIGNHSDELTPWIPVIAARSSYKMRVFLLPCCCFTFNGKFDRKIAYPSKYQSYLDFIEKLCGVMGFNVYRDKLRIPSTRRVCFICPSRNYEIEEEEVIDFHRSAFIHEHSKTDNNADIAGVENSELHAENQTDSPPPYKEILDNVNTNAQAWNSSFKPIEKTEPVRNCSNLDKAYVESTMKTVCDMLLQMEDFVELDCKGSKILWNKGGTLHIKDIASALDQEVLKQLKNKCGGLQTLFRSRRNTFTDNGGNISLTLPSTETSISRRKKKVKNNNLKRNDLALKFATKPCFFYFHHPQGCPLDDQCTFSHDRNI